MKTAIVKTRNNIAEKRICELEDRSFELSSKKKKGIKNNEERNKK